MDSYWCTSRLKAGSSICWKKCGWQCICITICIILTILIVASFIYNLPDITVRLIRG